MSRYLIISETKVVGKRVLGSVWALNYLIRRRKKNKKHNNKKKNDYVKSTMCVLSKYHDVSLFCTDADFFATWHPFWTQSFLLQTRN